MKYSWTDLLNFASLAGFMPGDAKIIAAIALAESGGDDQAVNPNDPNGGSFGALQINGIHPGAKDTLGNAALSFKMAYDISKGGSDFTPWSTYTSGRYLKFMPQMPPAPITQPTGSTMNPAANAAASGSTAGAAVIVLGYALTFLHIALPADVAAAIQILLTSGIGYFLHTQTRSKTCQPQRRLPPSPSSIPSGAP